MGFHMQDKFRCQLNFPVQINTTEMYKNEPYYRCKSYKGFGIKFIS